MADLNLLPNISPKVGRLSGLLGVAPASLLTTELRRSSVHHHTSLMQPLLPASTTTVRGAVSVCHSSHNEARIRNDFWQSNVCPCLNFQHIVPVEFSSMQCFGQTTISSQLSKWSGPFDISSLDCARGIISEETCYELDIAESERGQKCRDVPASLQGSIQAQGDHNADDITNH